MGKRTVTAVIDRFHLKPSRWVPPFRTPKEGIYQVAYPIIKSGKDVEIDENDPSFHRFMNGYELMWSWCYHRRTERGEDSTPGLIERLWDGLFELSIGAWDWIDPESWEEVGSNS